MMSKRLILLVEDNPDDEELTLRALKASNVLNEVVVARDGAQALEYLHGRPAANGDPAPPLPDMVLLDLKLPKVDGLQVLEAIRADDRTRLMPVVILTSSDEEKDRLKAYLNGANSYVRKPVDFDQFAEAVRLLGLYWLVLNVTPSPSTAKAGAVA